MPAGGLGALCVGARPGGDGASAIHGALGGGPVEPTAELAGSGGACPPVTHREGAVRLGVRAGRRCPSSLGSRGGPAPATPAPWLQHLLRRPLLPGRWATADRRRSPRQRSRPAGRHHLRSLHPAMDATARYGTRPLVSDQHHPAQWGGAGRGWSQPGPGHEPHPGDLVPGDRLLAQAHGGLALAGLLPVDVRRAGWAGLHGRPSSTDPLVGPERLRCLDHRSSDPSWGQAQLRLGGAVRRGEDLHRRRE